jgi:hypothetical protein
MPDSKPQWTPGPWTYAPIPGYQYVVEIDKPAQIMLVAGAVPPGREAEVRANMQCASAAPDLYAALVAVDAALRYHPGGDCRADKDILIARAALLKANPHRHCPACKMQADGTDAKCATCGRGVEVNPHSK